MHEYVISKFNNNSFLQLFWDEELDIIKIVDLTDEKYFKKYTNNIFFNCDFNMWVKSDYVYVDCLEIISLGIDYRLFINFKDNIEEEFYFKLKYC